MHSVNLLTDEDIAQIRANNENFARAIKIIENLHEQIIAYETNLKGYKAEQVCQMWDTNPMMLHRWKKAGKLIPKKMGKNNMYLYKDLLTFLDVHCIRDKDKNRMQVELSATLPKSHRR